MHSDTQIKPLNDIKHSDNIKLSVCCRYCKNINIIKKGKRKTKNRDYIQKFFCKICKKSFCYDDGFYKMKNNPNRITQAIDTYFEGLSSRKCKRNLERYSETKISHATILNWCRKYILKVTPFLDIQKPVLDKRQYTDETSIKTKGETHNLGIVMDKETRFITATFYWDKKCSALTPEDIAELWRKAKDVKRPEKWRTDSHGSYKRAFNSVFYTRYKENRVKWEKHNCSKTGKFNYSIERLNRNLKDRLRTIYGFKALWSAPILLHGWVIYYNYIRPHMGIDNITPSEKAQINLNLGENKWLDLIKFSTQYLYNQKIIKEENYE